VFQLARLLLFSGVCLAACSSTPHTSSRSAADENIDNSVCVELGMELVDQKVAERTVAQVVANCEIQCDEVGDGGDACDELRRRLEQDHVEQDLVQRVSEACQRSQQARRAECEN